MSRTARVTSGWSLCAAGAAPTPCNAGAYCPAGTGSQPSDDSCPAGEYCAAGAAPTPCNAGAYCPAGTGSQPSDDSCPAGEYCAAGAAPTPCNAGAYCPAGASSPSLFSCDLAQQACPGGSDTCPGPVWVRQSTFYNAYSPLAHLALDSDDAGSCIRTAAPSRDTNPQWWRVDLGSVKTRIGTVRIRSDSQAPQGLSYFKVLVSKTDAPADSDSNPSQGATIPSDAEVCYEHNKEASGESGDEVFEIVCGSSGQFVWIVHGETGEELRLCTVEVYDHECGSVSESGELSCGPGSQPGPSSCDRCPQCVPCPAGSYSDETGDGACAVCPGGANSPPGSMSELQCEGSLTLSGSSHMAVKSAAFDASSDSWKIKIEYKTSERVDLSTFFISKGGSSANRQTTSLTYDGQNFPCRVDPGQYDALSNPLAGTACCLQVFRDEYVMPRAFRNFSDTLDLVAANDKCDADDGSKMLMGVDVPLLGSAGYEFVDSEGRFFESAIRMDPHAEESAAEGMRYAMLTIPDSELFKVSKAVPQSTRREAITDGRELFVGLLDMVPTGTRVLDSASQQVSVVLTKTSYGSMSSFGAQVLDYSFISFLNARVHQVFDAAAEPEDARRTAAYYAAITFVYDETLSPTDADAPVPLSTVAVQEGSASVSTNPCENLVDARDVFLDARIAQTCGPSTLDFTNGCPQSSVADNNFGQIYIPLTATQALDAGSVDITFGLGLKDANDLDSVLTVNILVTTDEFTSWCAKESSDNIDLAGMVSAKLLVGTPQVDPVSGTILSSPVPAGLIPGDPSSTSEFISGARDLQDGLLTLALTLTESSADTTGLEVFVEDVVIVHFNPSARLTATQVQGSMLPTVTYDPATRDAKIEINADLATACPSVQVSPSLFGCVHKHVIENKAVTDNTAVYKIGSGGANEFMAGFLEGAASSELAEEMGTTFETELTDGTETHGFDVDNSLTTAFWVNTGNKWGGVTSSVYSLSQEVLVYVLFGVNAGAGARRRMLLQAGGSSSSSLTTTVRNDVDAGSLVASVLGIPEDLVSSCRVSMELDASEACQPEATLRTTLTNRFRNLVALHATPLRDVQLASMRVVNADCSGATRRAAGVDAPHVVMDLVVALEPPAEGDVASIDWQALQAAPGVLALTQTTGEAFSPADSSTDSPSTGGLPAPATGSTPAPGGPPGAAAPPAADSEQGSKPLLLIVATALGGVIACLAAWMTYSRLRRGQAGAGSGIWLSESADAVPLDKIQIESKLMCVNDASESAPKPPPFSLTPSTSPTGSTAALPCQPCQDGTASQYQ